MATINRVNVTDRRGEPESLRRTAVQNQVAHFAQKISTGWWKVLLVTGDSLLILIAFALAYLLRYDLQWFRAVDPASTVEFFRYAPFMFAYLVLVISSFFLSDVYPYERGRNVIEEIYKIGTATTLGTVILITVSLFFQQTLLSRLIFLYCAILVTMLVGLSRVLIQAALRALRRFGLGVDRVILVGAGDVGRMVMRTLTARPDIGYQLVGFLDDNPNKGNTDIGRYRALGSIDNFEKVLNASDIDSVIICLPWQSHRRIQSLLRVCDQRKLPAQVVPDLFQVTKKQMKVRDLNGIPLISTRSVSIQGGNLVIKRLSDLLLSIVGGVVAVPLVLLIALAIRLDSEGPVLYTQTRIGKNGRPFRCFKFRSMVADAEEMQTDLSDLNEASGPLFKVRNDPRLTRVGRFLRRTSLDELPQVINVLRGEMSLVGPRPNLPSETEAYEEWHKGRLAVSPGMTGLWQVSGRSDLTFDEMVLLDIYYAEHWNLALDMSILLRSIPAVLNARGAY